MDPSSTSLAQFVLLEHLTSASIEQGGALSIAITTGPMTGCRIDGPYGYWSAIICRTYDPDRYMCSARDGGMAHAAGDASIVGYRGLVLVEAAQSEHLDCNFPPRGDDLKAPE